MTLQLESLKNKVSVAFLLGNGMIIVTILVMEKAGLQIPWPLGDDNYIDPISLVFLVCFGAVLFIQMCGMLVHRMGTYLHIMAATNLPCRKNIFKNQDKDNLDYYTDISRQLIHGDSDKADSQSELSFDGSQSGNTTRKIAASMRRINSRKSETLTQTLEKQWEVIDESFERGDNELVSKRSTKKRKSQKEVHFRRARLQTRTSRRTRGSEPMEGAQNIVISDGLNNIPNLDQINEEGEQYATLPDDIELDMQDSGACGSDLSNDNFNKLSSLRRAKTDNSALTRRKPNRGERPSSIHASTKI